MGNSSSTLIIKNFKSYVPPKDHALADTGAAFLISEDGKDWYDCQKEFKEDTYKLQLSPDDRLVALTQDVSSLFPYNCSVVEIEKLPEFIQLKRGCVVGDYIFDYETNEIKERTLSETEIKSKVDREIDVLLKDIYSKITPLQYAVDLKISTSSEEELLNKYKKYAVELSRINLQKDYPLKVDWPLSPSEEKLKES